MPYPGVPLVQDRRQLPDAADPGEVRDDEVRRVAVGAAQHLLARGGPRKCRTLSHTQLYALR